MRRKRRAARSPTSSTARIRTSICRSARSSAPGRARKKAARSISNASRSSEMKTGAARLVSLGLAGLLLAVAPVAAHHEILAKFDDKKPITLKGVVTLVDWKNPHVHVFLNVRDRNQLANWAVEL